MKVSFKFIVSLLLSCAFCLQLFAQQEQTQSNAPESQVEETEEINEDDLEYEQYEDDYTYQEPEPEVIEEDTAVEVVEDSVEPIIEEEAAKAVRRESYRRRSLNEKTTKEWREEQTSTSKTEEISEETIKKYKKDRKFRYQRKNSGVDAPDGNWFRRFLEAIADILEKVFGFKISQDAFKVIKWLLIFSVGGFLLYLIVKYANININPFKKKKKPTLETVSFEEIEKNLEEVDFNDLIEQAIKAGSYRVAVRLLFLKSLQSLTKKNLIEWEIDKTNVDYKYELANTKLKDDFDEIVYLFEHIWYGDFELSDEDYQQSINVFRKFDKRLGY